MAGKTIIPPDLLGILCTHRKCERHRDDANHTKDYPPNGFSFPHIGIRDDIHPTMRTLVGVFIDLFTAMWTRNGLTTVIPAFLKSIVEFIVVL